MSGFSKRQLETATRIASIPEDDFEAMVERGATVTEMAAAGTQRQARAVRRAGELLAQIDGQGQRSDLQPSVGAHTKLTQDDAAREAGFSKHQQVQAVRRAGELLAQIEPGQGARDGKREEVDHLPLRSAAAREWGG